jgi:hypothetical protein
LLRARQIDFDSDALSGLALKLFDATIRGPSLLVRARPIEPNTVVLKHAESDCDFGFDVSRERGVASRDERKRRGQVGLKTPERVAP